MSGISGPLNSNSNTGKNINTTTNNNVNDKIKENKTSSSKESTSFDDQPFSPLGTVAVSGKLLVGVGGIGGGGIAGKRLDSSEGEKEVAKDFGSNQNQNQNQHQRTITNSSTNSGVGSLDYRSPRLEYKPQSPDERYALPENFLEVEVTNPITHGDSVTSSFTDYEIICRTNIPVFKKQQSSVRRRYSEFEWFRDLMERENSRVVLPPLPGKFFFRTKLSDPAIEERRSGLERFMQIVAGHPLLQTGSSAKIMILFMQEQGFNKLTMGQYLK